jgi:copper chaperone CopZ
MLFFKSRKKMAKIKLHVEGMGCPSCAQRVEKAILTIPGVDAASIDLKAKRATVAIPDAVPVQSIIDAIDAAGYEAKLETA